jgi:hypothetical protein
LRPGALLATIPGVKRFALLLVLTAGCPWRDEGECACDASAMLRVVAVLSGGDAEACSHIWNVGIEVDVGNTTLGNSDAIATEAHPGESFRWDFAWPSGVGGGDAGEVRFYGDGEALTRASGTTTFVAAPSGFQYVEVNASCGFEVPDAGP